MSAREASAFTDGGSTTIVFKVSYNNFNDMHEIARVLLESRPHVVAARFPNVSVVGQPATNAESVHIAITPIYQSRNEQTSHVLPTKDWTYDSSEYDLSVAEIPLPDDHEPVAKNTTTVSLPNHGSHVERTGVPLGTDDSDLKSQADALVAEILPPENGQARSTESSKTDTTSKPQ